jgi:hypothetical protein
VESHLISRLSGTRGYVLCGLQGLKNVPKHMGVQLGCLAYCVTDRLC